MTAKKIKFIFIGEYAKEVIEKPQPSQAYIPEWFKNMEPYQKSPQNPDGTKIIIENGFSNATAKKCMPMLDGITSGYTVPLWADVTVTRDNQGAAISWDVSKEVFAEHGPSGRHVTPPAGYSNQVFKYSPWFKIQTPPGYSILVKHPAGHNDLPFQTIPAIIDTDKNVIDGSFPMWIKEGFEGTVKKGTPLVQIFPFKRENWEAEFDWITEEQQLIEQDKGFWATIQNNYVKNVWVRKTYK
jgi:hypothetical protein